jgi:23S rRNA pseudouridine1911/1915/1917 synthase
MNTKRKGEWFEITVPPEWNGLTINQVLRDQWKGPKKQIHQLRMDNGVQMNGKPADWHAPLHAGDRLQIHFFKEQDFGVIPTFMEIDVLYEDDHLLVVNKPAGIDTHPNHPDECDTLANAVAYYLLAKGEHCKVIHVHRLDRNTTGTVLFAKHSFIGALLDRLLEERKIKRIYLAIADGIIKKSRGTIDAPIGSDRHHPTKRRVSPTGQRAVTHYQVIQRLKKENQTIIKCVLDTGRTHQIRVHLASIGHPLCGDTLYGGKPVYPRQALHAARLEFIHPFTQEKITCNAPFLDGWWGSFFRNEVSPLKL